MQTSEVGEFGLIERIAKRVPRNGPGVLVGIGDDMAVLQPPDGKVLLATCDAQVENVHFLRGAISPYQLGRKTVAVNVSDVASMGGRPLWALVSLTLPGDLEVEFVDELYRGMLEELQWAGASIVGGNMSGTDTRIVVDMTLLGAVEPGHMMLRSGAREGDTIFVTGTLGDSRAGLELIRSPALPVSEAVRRSALDRHLTPRARLEEGRILAESGKVHAMADVSDGLWADIGHICRAAGVGAKLHRMDLPVSEACAEIARLVGANADSWALTGGEDYELVFTAPGEVAEELDAALRKKTGVGCRAVGKIVGGPYRVDVVEKDGTVTMSSGDTHGWDHFGKTRTPSDSLR